ncbi:restriction endonuclease subunit S [Clostridium kluyveri]|uniref:restriction endonuclease subunit S n=1 Tax=Clostridium kluyveri TaxID=1534 RepID=UPI002246A597|nr:restriction endonuclease subunit S [Clostridium kluyveri]UZQ48953.1 restriction endonuclease subunit S [Clostridium kluyveri]
MEKNNNEPKLRFLGFTDPWEQRKLGELLTQRKILQKVSDDVPLLAFAAGQGVIDRSERKSNNRDQLTLDPTNKIYLLTEYNDIVYNPSNLKYGAIDRNKHGKGVISPIYVTFITDEEPSFIELIVKSEKFRLRALQFEEGTVVKRQSVKPENLLTLDVKISQSHKEQRKIGMFFEQLDHLITLHQRKLNHLQDKKKGLLQKMFPKNGEDFPELRFPEFTDSWEQRKLGDIVPITMGQSPDGSTYSDTPSDYILVQGNADLKNGWVTPRVWTYQVTKKAEAGDLIMSVRAPAGEMGKTAYNVVIGRGVAAIKGNEFIFQSLVKMNGEGYWKKLSCGSTFESLNSDNIKNAKIMIPNLDEQVTIGAFFKNFDNLITLHQRKLNHLQEQKKSLLQQMFI